MTYTCITLGYGKRDIDFILKSDTINGISYYSRLSASNTIFVLTVCC